MPKGRRSLACAGQVPDFPVVHVVVAAVIPDFDSHCPTPVYPITNFGREFVLMLLHRTGRPMTVKVFFHSLAARSAYFFRAARVSRGHFGHFGTRFLSGHCRINNRLVPIKNVNLRS